MSKYNSFFCPFCCRNIEPEFLHEANKKFWSRLFAVVPVSLCLVKSLSKTWSQKDESCKRFIPICSPR